MARSLCSRAICGTRPLEKFDFGDGSSITSFHTSLGTPSAPGALLLGVSASAPIFIQIVRWAVGDTVERVPSARFDIAPVFFGAVVQ
ncbi:hypothetical protein AYI69_g3480 [Smittium culicis]|uniref:Uncharacterized protein n=1 Tax=Smittium culicis TaxID=133412 RepID=A0A1R1YJM7_9FUNG|nr:hypothetical protein AYI69_g3480 [Smittium culicis]